MQDKFNQLKSILTTAEEDLGKFMQKGNKSAGVRLRKSLQDLRQLAQELRKDILDSRK